MDQEKNQVLTTNEACRYLRISRRTFLKLVHTKQIRTKKVGRGWRVLVSGLIAFFENGTTPEQRRVDEQTPRHDEAADEIDQAILWILSICEHKRLLQISCKPKEGDVIKARLTEEEEDRIWLGPLEDRALVERIIEAGADGDIASVSIPVENIK